VPTPNKPSGNRLILTLDAGLVPLLLPFLQSGIKLHALVGCSVQSFLCDQLELDPAYLDRRVQTIFLDGKAVDDIHTTIVGPGAVISLSAALPGLLGAVLRRDSPYAAMREQISHEEVPSFNGPPRGIVVIKLFNLLIPEIGPQLLMRGGWIQEKALKRLVRTHSDLFRTGCHGAQLDGNPIDLLEWADRERSKDEIFLGIRGA
jgi:hypothetical protein